MVARIVVVVLVLAAVALVGRVSAQTDALELFPAAAHSNPVMRAYALSLRRQQENSLLRNRRQKAFVPKANNNDNSRVLNDDVDSTLLEADRLYDEIVNELDALVSDLARQHEREEQRKAAAAVAPAASANSAQMPSWLRNLMIARRQL